MKYLTHKFLQSAKSLESVDDIDEFKFDWISRSIIDRAKDVLLKLKYKKLTNEEIVADMITSRIEEIKKMCFKRKLIQINIEELPDSLKDYIQELNEIPSRVYRENSKKKFKSKIDLFRNVARIVLIMVKSLLHNRRYFLDRWLENFSDDPGINDSDIEKMRHISLNQLHNAKSALTADALTSLNTIFDLRDENTIKKILWLIKRLNVFELVIPHDMMNHLAKRVTYERYENGRIIANENDVAKRLYYIISGKIKLVKKFDLSGGDLFKIIGFLNKGDSTDPEEVEKGWLREYTLVAKGVVEVLAVDRNDLYKLRYHYHNVPIEFLKSIDLFSTYPFESLIKTNETIMYQYFGPNQIISKDAEESPWLYVVKSGSIKIVKKMKIIDIDKQPKTPSFYLLRTPTIIPPVNQVTLHRQPSSFTREKTDEEWNKPNDIKRIKSVVMRPRFNSMVREATLPPIKLGINNPIDETATIENRSISSNEFISTQFIPSARLDKSINSSIKSSKQTTKAQNTHKPINNNAKRLISTAGTTMKALGDNNIYKTGHVVIEYLDKGSIFGLNSINDTRKNIKKFRREKDVKNESDKIILISEGSELILLSKRSFLNHADVDTLCKIEKMVHPYMGQEQARNLIFQTEKWKAYKKNLLHTLVTHSIDVL